MKIPTIHSSNVKAYVLFTTISVLFIATTFVLSFYTTLYSKELRINYKIAETQALFNAETGVAETAYPFLVKSSFVNDTTLSPQIIEQFDMGLYLGPKMEFASDGQRVATVEGVSFIRTANGFKVTNPEGYVAIDRATGGAVKLVDRMEFSFNNFTAVKAWDK